ncbi:MAG: PLP-dependent aminotransferase family protein [Candidatus Melainabacteria bacterium]|nr:PLP-dependent aminotransferase family protein [Candidatus Melainabacteria bacterium]
MRENTRPNTLISISLDFESSTNLFKQIVSSIRRRIESGELAAGDKLPSTRQLASTLKISRSTTSAAYAELHRLGLIDNATHAGTFVARRVLSHRQKNIQEHQKECETSPHEQLLNFAPDDSFACSAMEIQSLEFAESPFIPQQLLPQKKWNQLLRQRQMHDSPFYNQSPQDSNFHWRGREQYSEIRLRRSLAAYLERTRGIEIDPDQIVVFGNERQALHAITTVLIKEGDMAVLEDPCSPSVKALFLARYPALTHIAVDISGLLVHQLQGLENVKLIYTTPSNQTPLGLTMQKERREALLDYAEKSDALILENDCNHELVYGSNFMPSLKSTDRDNRIVYFSSFSRCLSPLTDLAFVAAPASIAHKVSGARTLFGTSASPMEIDVVAAMLESGYLERYFYSLRACFSPIRRRLIQCLAATFGQSVYLYPSAMGNTICARFNDAYPQDRLVEIAINNGLPAFDASPFFTKDAGHRLLFSLPHLDEETLAERVFAFKSELDKSVCLPPVSCTVPVNR